MTLATEQDISTEDIHDSAEPLVAEAQPIPTESPEILALKADLLRDLQEVCEIQSSRYGRRPSTLTRDLKSETADVIAIIEKYMADPKPSDGFSSICSKDGHRHTLEYRILSLKYKEILPETIRKAAETKLTDTGFQINWPALEFEEQMRQERLRRARH